MNLFTCVLYGIMLLDYVQTATQQIFYYHNKTLRCHCKLPKQCREGGVCPLNQCAWPYIGSTCQHVHIEGKLKIDAIQKFPKLTDGDDATCEDSSFQGKLVYNLKQAVRFFWIYIARRASDERLEPTLKLYRDLASVDVTPTFFKINDNAVLIKIAEHVTYNVLELTDLPSDTCSVDISLGRDLALSGSVNQSSVFDAHYAKRAIDGNDTSCSSTSDNAHEWWKLHLKYEAKINVVEFNISRVYQKCFLQRFNLKLKSSSGEEVFNFDEAGGIARDNYSIAVGDHHPPAREVVISINKTNQPRRCSYYGQLKLCEVRIYGEFQCPDGKYGALCEVSCPGGCSRDRCDPDWGCLGACKDGWGLVGSWCSLDCRKKYGLKCDLHCSENCGGHGHCSRDTGDCLEGCVLGFYKPNCTMPCPAGHFGANCEEECVNCKKNNVTDVHECDPATGACLDGCAEGYDGDACLKVQHKKGGWDLGLLSFPLLGLLAGIFLLCLLVSVCPVNRRKKSKRQGAAVTDDSDDDDDSARTRGTEPQSDDDDDDDSGGSSRQSSQYSGEISRRQSRNGLRNGGISRQLSGVTMETTERSSRESVLYTDYYNGTGFYYV